MSKQLKLYWNFFDRIGPQRERSGMSKCCPLYWIQWQIGNCFDAGWIWQKCNKCSRGPMFVESTPVVLLAKHQIKIGFAEKIHSWTW